jgi:hypothetical protein
MHYEHNSILLNWVFTANQLSSFQSILSMGMTDQGKSQKASVEVFFQALNFTEGVHLILLIVRTN